VPLLVESGRWRAIVDRVLVVDATEETQLRRVIARSGWTPEAVRAVIAQQAPRKMRRAAADAVIFNESLDAGGTRNAQVRGLWKLWAAARHAIIRDLPLRGCTTITTKGARRSASPRCFSIRIPSFLSFSRWS
jgi:hypothetical protein